MRRIPAVLMAAFILLVAFGIGAWQNSQQNFGNGLPGGLFFTPPTLTVSSVGNGNGTLSLAGNTSGTATLAAPAVAGTATNPLLISNSLQFPSGTALNWNNDTGLSRDSAGVIDVGNGSAGNVTGTVKAGAYATGTKCAAVGSAANPSVAACGSAAAGVFSCATASTGVCQVNTTALVNANSTVIVMQDSSTTTGTLLGVTCLVTASLLVPQTTAKVAGTSFTITVTAPAVNPDCFQYVIIN